MFKFFFGELRIWKRIRAFDYFLLCCLFCLNGVLCPILFSNFGLSMCIPFLKESLARYFACLLWRVILSGLVASLFASLWESCLNCGCANTRWKIRSFATHRLTTWLFVCTHTFNDSKLTKNNNAHVACNRGWNLLYLSYFPAICLLGTVRPGNMKR